MRYKSYIASTTSKDDPRFKDLYLFHGKSAYQAAVEMGYKGTEEEWIDSLTELRWGSLADFEVLPSSHKQRGIAYFDTIAGKIYKYDEESQKFVDTEISTYDKEGNPIHSTFLKRSGGIMTGENPLLFESSEDTSYASNHIRFNTGNDRIGADRFGNLGMFASGNSIQFRVNHNDASRGTFMDKDSFRPIINNEMLLGTSTMQWSNIWSLGISGNTGTSGSGWGVRSGIDDTGTAYAELFTKDGGTEPIYARQYKAGSILHELTLLDENGDMHIPNNATINGSMTVIGQITGNIDTASKLKTPCYFHVGTAVTATKQLFDGSNDITIAITAIDPSYITQSESYRLVSDSQIAAWDAKPTQAEMSKVIADLINESPELLNTLDELAAALGDDPNFATTMATELSKKFDKAGGEISGNVNIGGVLAITGKTTLTGALNGTNATFDGEIRSSSAVIDGTLSALTAIINGDLVMLGNNQDRWIQFTSLGDPTSAGHGFRLGYLGTGAGNENYFSLEGGASGETWLTAMRFGAETFDVDFAGHVLPLVNNSKNLGSSSMKWAEAYATTFYGALSGNATSANNLKSQTQISTAAELDAFLEASMAKYTTFKMADGEDPGFAFGSGDGMLLSLPWTSTDYGFQMAFDDTDAVNIVARGKSKTWGSWVKLIHSGNYTDYVEPKGHTHSYLALTGGTVTGATTFSNTVTVSKRLTADGKLTIPSTGGNWTTGMTLSNCSIQVSTQNSASAYHPILGGKTYNGHYWNIGSITDKVGFYGFKSGRTENDTDWKAEWDVTTGNFTNTGTITGSKVYNATWNDYAEWYEREDTEEVFEAGDIVTWSEDGVVKTTEAFDPCVVGVYSDTYGHIVGGNWLDDMEDNIATHVPVGLCGRVHVKVVGKANRGDLIVSSDIPGVGMAISPKDAYPGVVIGKVLKKKETEEIEKIKIQIMLQ